jgi:hypothetical protein
MSVMLSEPHAQMPCRNFPPQASVLHYEQSLYFNLSRKNNSETAGYIVEFEISFTSELPMSYICPTFVETLVLSLSMTYIALG